MTKTVFDGAKRPRRNRHAEFGLRHIVRARRDHRDYRALAGMAATAGSWRMSMEDVAMPAIGFVRAAVSGFRREGMRRLPALLATALATALAIAAPQARADSHGEDAQRYANAMLLPLQLRTTQAVQTLQTIDPASLDPASRQIVACMRTRFSTAEQAPGPPASAEGSPVADGILAAFRHYWRDALLRGPEPTALESAEEGLLAQLRSVLGATPADGWDRIDERMAQSFAAMGWHAQLGITPPLRELIVWTDEDVIDERVTLPGGQETVRVVFMRDFRSRGWAHYATCGRSAAGGWTTTDRLYAASEDYDRGSERYRVGYLAHEGQHFRDKRLFVGAHALPPWRLEYRAKLVELALAEQGLARTLANFSADTSEDPRFPHSYANLKLIEAIRSRFDDGGAARRWPPATPEAQALVRHLATELLAQDDRELGLPQAP